MDAILKEQQQAMQRKSLYPLLAKAIIILCIVSLGFSIYFLRSFDWQIVNYKKELYKLNNEVNQTQSVIKEFSDLDNIQNQNFDINVRDFQVYARQYVEFFKKQRFMLSNITYKLGASQSQETVMLRTDNLTGIEYSIMEVAFQYRYWSLVKELFIDLKNSFSNSAVVSMEVKGKDVVLKVLHIKPKDNLGAEK